MQLAGWAGACQRRGWYVGVCEKKKKKKREAETDSERGIEICLRGRTRAKSFFFFSFFQEMTDGMRGSKERRKNESKEADVKRKRRSDESN